LELLGVVHGGVELVASLQDSVSFVEISFGLIVLVLERQGTGEGGEREVRGR
jgi:hypothetical protein